MERSGSVTLHFPNPPTEVARAWHGLKGVIAEHMGDGTYLIRLDETSEWVMLPDTHLRFGEKQTKE